MYDGVYVRVHVFHCPACLAHTRCGDNQTHASCASTLPRLQDGHPICVSLREHRRIDYDGRLGGVRVDRLRQLREHCLIDLPHVSLCVT